MFLQGQTDCAFPLDVLHVPNLFPTLQTCWSSPPALAEIRTKLRVDSVPFSWFTSSGACFSLFLLCTLLDHLFLRGMELVPIPESPGGGTAAAWFALMVWSSSCSPISLPNILLLPRAAPASCLLLSLPLPGFSHGNTALHLPGKAVSSGDTGCSSA